MQYGKTTGFTLVELMVTVAIMAIIMAIAYPTYVSQVAKGRRAAAKAALVELAQYLERNYTESQRYDKTSSGAAITLPYTQAPRDGSTKFYDLSLQSVSQNTFVLQAVPKNGQQTSDARCGTLTLDQRGVKGATGTDGATACWGG